MSLSAAIQRGWVRPNLLTWLCLPLTALFVLVSAIRRRLYVAGVLRQQRLPVPVVIVGNITAGGSGKTPVVIALAESLAAEGYTPGVISRGYQGSAHGSVFVSPDSDPAVCGDEPVLLARRSACPVVVGRDRVCAGKRLLAAHPEVDVLISDDGLQHYALARDIEIAVIDERGVGNGWRLPSGPLREPISRLEAVHGLVLNGTPPSGPALPAKHMFNMRLVAGACYALDNPATRCELKDLVGARVHAIAGVGNPRRFFDSLRAAGLDIECHAYPDHHAFRPEDLHFPAGETVLMTEKDAVKCQAFAPRGCWVLPVSASFSPELASFIIHRLHGPQAS